MSSATKSPAAPLTKAPATAASKGSAFCARKAPTMPESTSPVPPTVMPALPVKFSLTRFPSQITSTCPFNKIIACSFAAVRCTSSTRSDRLSDNFLPVSTAYSPVCGVSTNGTFNNLLNSAKAFKPSASKSKALPAFSMVVTQALTNSLVSECKPRPGPKATASTIFT